MSIKATMQKDKAYSRTEPGSKLGVCVDVYTKTAIYDNKPSERIHFVWEIDEVNPDSKDGNPYLVFQSYNFYLSNSSRLGMMLSSWMGKEIPEDVEVNFEKFIDRNCILGVSHSPNAKKPESPWVNVDSVLPLMKGQTGIKASGAYTRKKDRNDDDTKSERRETHDDNAATSRDEEQMRMSEHFDVDEELPF